ncbi:MAG: hypothetical protein Tsb0019_37870 [Roseibium sp.]
MSGYQTLFAVTAAFLMTVETAGAAVVGSPNVLEKITPIFAEITVDGSGSPVSSEPIANAQQTQGGDDAYSATATMNTSGSSSVDARNTNDGYIAYSGDTTKRTVRAAADFIASYTNVGSTQVFGIFSYTISDMLLQVVNGGGFPSTAKVSHEFKVLFGASPSSFSGEIELTGNYNDFQITSVSGFESPTVEREECYMDTCQRGVAAIADLSKQYSLGILDPGETVSLYYSLAVEIGFNGTEVGATARAMDPGGPIFTASAVPASTVPLPAAGWLLVTSFGMTLLAGTRRKR